MALHVHVMARISEARVGLPCPAQPEDVVARFRGSDGRFVDATLDRLPVDDVLAGLPVREFRWYRGRRHYSGWYWAATTAGHVVYESRLELARIMLADRDPDVVAMAAQPVWLAGMDDGRVRRHVPDLLLAHRGGRLTFVDVKAASRLADQRVVAQFAWMKAMCARFEFGFEVWSGVDPVVLENVRFLAGYRAVGLIREELVGSVLAAAREPVPLGQVERVAAQGADRGWVRPVVLHALWRGLLDADLSRPLDVSTPVAAVGGMR
ncbi:TnsA-like heteromeric transposase endonuclease subunit [Actinocrinis puniceicyclus]|uniref:TnsA-like heteromeric transposase endonuclease subunit n=1 Tax=Actinocrinis puniceicyclus TaxID=977794 RepID=A0A8J7WQ25_9ACTN|nr:TnsA-like heteromeric transposase endonuclease subunit [Actinocrinis puniceicyclus]MBS2963439.1 TnsA-like heteromeric transposase endonuclease subunit [Actinocrinis puniceicyclus]